MAETMTASNPRRVELKGFEWFTHYSIVVFLWLLPAVFPLALLRSPRNAAKWPAAIAGLVLGAIALWQQRRALRYRLVRTTRSAEANFDSVLALAETEGWRVTRHGHGAFIEAAVRGSWVSWGERVSVLFIGPDVYVNSICDPDRHGSVSSWGRNKRNMEEVIRTVRPDRPSFGGAASAG